MKTLLIFAGFISFSVPLLAQQPDNPAGSELAKLRQNYVTSLDALLKQYVKDDNVLGAAAVSEELDHVSTPLSLSSVEASPCGRWDDWSGGPVTINSNGTTRLDGSNASRGIWHWVDQAQRTIQIHWQNGYIDKGTISPDGHSMHVSNDVDFKFVTHRALPSDQAR